MARQNRKLDKWTAAIAFGVMALFLLFVMHMIAGERAEISSTRRAVGVQTLQKSAYTHVLVEDASLPGGMKQVCTWQITPAQTARRMLCFYLVHQEAEVRIDGEPVGSLRRGDGLLGRTFFAWVRVPLYTSDAGKTIEITIMPVYGPKVNQEPVFLLGTEAEVLRETTRNEAVQIVLSGLGLLLGVVVCLVQLVLLLRKRAPAIDMVYLGCSVMLLGLWRAADASSTALLFAAHPLPLAYLSLSAMYLAMLPMMMYIQRRLMYLARLPMLLTVLADAAVLLVILALQLLGVADLRECLPVYHLLLVCTTVSVCINGLLSYRHGGMSHRGVSWKVLLLLGPAAMLDLVCYYVNANTADLLFTLTMFMAYVLARFVESLRSTMQRANRDPFTGLISRTRWDELVDQYLPQEDCGVMMLDLNMLKQVNDSLGHEAGDGMIFAFANIVRNVIPADGVVCRWGGDEFTVLLPCTDRPGVEKLLQRITAAVDQYNAGTRTAQIHFAAGAALARENPDASIRQLLRIADEHMYVNKKEWYAQRPGARS